jgi:hypothetical protein
VQLGVAPVAAKAGLTAQGAQPAPQAAFEKGTQEPSAPQATWFAPQTQASPAAFFWNPFAASQVKPQVPAAASHEGAAWATPVLQARQAEPQWPASWAWQAPSWHSAGVAEGHWQPVFAASSSNGGLQANPHVPEPASHAAVAWATPVAQARQPGPQ